MMATTHKVAHLFRRGDVDSDLSDEEECAVPVWAEGRARVNSSAASSDAKAFAARFPLGGDAKVLKDLPVRMQPEKWLLLLPGRLAVPSHRQSSLAAFLARQNKKPRDSQQQFCAALSTSPPPVVLWPINTSAIAGYEPGTHGGRLERPF